MSKEELFSILEIGPESNIQTIEHAYQKWVQNHSPEPDVEDAVRAAIEDFAQANGEDAFESSLVEPSDDVEFAGALPTKEVRNSETCGVLSQGEKAHIMVDDGSDGSEPSSKAPDQRSRATEQETLVLFKEHLKNNRVHYRFDGHWETDIGPKQAMTSEDVDAVLAKEEINEDWLINDFLLDMSARGLKVKKSDATRAAMRVFASEQKRRVAQLMKPFLKTPDLKILAASDKEWPKFATLFDMNSTLCIGTFSHFIWQVKRKLNQTQVSHHLMPIIQSKIQGSGKTTFVSRFLSPLEELATDPVLLEDFIDGRNIGIYRFPVIFVDDVGAIPPKMVATLKTVITAPRIRRRELGTSGSKSVKQQSTLIGTANFPIEALIPDSTGHRRFITVPFRNGSLEKGGDPAIWETVSSLDYRLLWESIDPFRPSPIETCLDLLYHHQAAYVPMGDIYRWMKSFDPMDEDVRRITISGRIRADDLFDLFVKMTESEISQTQFGSVLKRSLNRPECPFERSVRTAKGRFYIPKKSES